MRAFMTTGTTHFLKKIIDTHPEKDFHLMKSDTSALIYYEDSKKKGIFVSGKTYDIVQDIGDIHEKGFVVMDHIPVSEEEMPVFEQRMKQQLTSFIQTPGVLAVKLLKEFKSNTFVILTQWRTERNHQDWKNAATTHELNFTKSMKLPAYFMERPFTNHYYMVYDEEMNNE